MGCKYIMLPASNRLKKLLNTLVWSVTVKIRQSGEVMGKPSRSILLFPLSLKRNLEKHYRLEVFLRE